MKKLLIFGSLFLIFGFTAGAFAVPQYLNYQGVLRDSSFNLVTGTKTMTFRIYDDATAGNKRFEMTTDEAVSNGLYTAQLGPIGYAELGSGRRWLEVTVGSDILLPRLEILSVAYAVTAANADSAGYATLSGTASTAVTATTATTATNANAVNGFSASSMATAGQILPLDSNMLLKGMSVSVEAAGNTYGLFVNSGKIGIKTSGTGTTSGDPTIGAVGTGTIPNLSTVVFVYNNNVTSNSIILLTVGPNAPANNNGGIKVTLTSSGPNPYFKVATMDGNPASANIPFYYMIIN